MFWILLRLWFRLLFWVRFLFPTLVLEQRSRVDTGLLEFLFGCKQAPRGVIVFLSGRRQIISGSKRLPRRPIFCLIDFGIYQSLYESADTHQRTLNFWHSSIWRDALTLNTQP